MGSDLKKEYFGDVNIGEIFRLRPDNKAKSFRKVKDGIAFDIEELKRSSVRITETKSMSSRNFQKPIRIKGKKLVLTKKMIEDAQSQTKSNMRPAARWLGVSYLTYRKYAKIYGLFEGHLNQSGVGIKKGYGRWIKSLDQILMVVRSIV